MRIVVAASLNPSFAHAKAGYVVLASLLEAFAALGQDTALVTVLCPNPVDEATLSRLRAAGVTLLGNVSDTAEADANQRSSLARWGSTLLRLVTPRRLSHDVPRFPGRREAEARVMAWRPDAVLLFWDSWFEHLLPTRMPVGLFGYLARPRFAAPLSACRERASRASSLADRLKNWLDERLWRQAAARHFRRLTGMRACANICALDAAMYRDHGIPCEYVPNTWPDAFGAAWRERRDAAEARSGKLSILANIGDVTATGNLFGLTYLATRLLPQLAARTSVGERFEFNICGKGTLPAELHEAFARYHVNVKGFVDDIDEEMLANRVLLVLNNAGPYTGGYTRVVYAFSAGACLVAHRALADSMPEVGHGENAVLGGDLQEIADHLLRLADDPGLARSLGEAGRHTYETRFAPEAVAGRLVAMMEGGRA